MNMVSGRGRKNNEKRYQRFFIKSPIDISTSQRMLERAKIPRRISWHALRHPFLILLASQSARLWLGDCFGSRQFVQNGVRQTYVPVSEESMFL
jgi:hypothetical protein